MYPLINYFTVITFVALFLCYQYPTNHLFEILLYVGAFCMILYDLKQPIKLSNKSQLDPAMDFALENC